LLFAGKMDTIEFNYIDLTLYIGLIHTKSDMVEKGDLTRFRCEKKEKYRVDKNNIPMDIILRKKIWTDKINLLSSAGYFFLFDRYILTEK